jgi:hypothetical protein
VLIDTPLIEEVENGGEFIKSLPKSCPFNRLTNNTGNCKDSEGALEKFSCHLSSYILGWKNMYFCTGL